MAKVLICSQNFVGKSMAGAAIRSWEFAKALSQNHEVVLISPKTDIRAENFQIISFHGRAYQYHIQNADILIAQRLTCALAFSAAFHRFKIIIDAYAPGPLERLEHFKADPTDDRHGKVSSEISKLILSFKMADGILCASEKQRELWIGFLLGQQVISPSLYDLDPSLRDFIGIIPFGLSSTPPKKRGKGLRERYGFHAGEKVIVWGGGIWNWFDPLSLIRAMTIISRDRSDIKLVFMGVQPPDSSLPSAAMAVRAMELAKERGLIDQSVFFHHEWIPYEERENVLLEADIGASIHFDHLETHFSFRTRILDYLWAGLPILATQGDGFAELIERQELGVIVPYQNERAIAHAIVSLVNHPDQLKKMKSNIAAIRGQFHWESVIAPLDDMIDRLTAHPRKRKIWKVGKALLRFVVTKLREKAIVACTSITRP